MHTPVVYLAAVDLGSNSFHLLISQWAEGKLTEVVRHKVMVQLARGMDEHHRLSPAALARAQSCLQEFNVLLQQYPCNDVRCIGTAALRQCQNLHQFLSMAEPILGCTIEIISGEQEANFVYQGVQHSLPAEQQNSPVLVVDMGGASTELIIGCGPQIHHWRSVELGCVDLANQFFCAGQSGPVSAVQLEQAYRYCCDQLAPFEQDFNHTQWQQVLGASGTMRVTLDLLNVNVALPHGSSSSVISRADLHILLNDLKRSGELSDIIPESLRWDVLPAGLALLQAIFDTFNLQQLTVSPGSIKEGVMLDSLARA